MFSALKAFEAACSRIERNIRYRRQHHKGFCDMRCSDYSMYIMSEIVPFLELKLRKVMKERQGLHPSEMAQDQEELFYASMREAARLEGLLQAVPHEKFTLLEGEYIFNQTITLESQIRGQIRGLQHEMRRINAVYNILGDPVRLNRNGTWQQRAAGGGAEQQRFAPHPQSLPPSDWPGYFYNGPDYTIGKHARPALGEAAGDAQPLVVSNRTWLPEFLVENLRRHPMFGGRANARMPPTCYYRSGLHGHGLFSCANVKSGMVIAEYAGEVIGRLLVELRDQWYQASGFNSVYMFDVRDDCGIDATFCGNLGRFINHACDNNCESTLLFREANGLTTRFHPCDQGVGVAERVIRQLYVGSECTQNYNMARVPFDQKIPCMCGSKYCNGFMN